MNNTPDEKEEVFIPPEPVTPSQEVAIQAPAGTAVVSTEQQMIQSIATMATDQNCDVDKMEKLLNIQMTMMDRQAKMDFDQALARVQADMPRITQNGQIKNKNGVVVAKYLKYEDIDAQIRPRLQAEGFSLIHDRKEENGKMIVTTTLKHRGGHQESVSMPLPYDAQNAMKNAVQAAVSTFSYGKRVNVCSMLNIVAEGEDDDAVSAGVILIDDSQAALIKKTIEESGADTVRFLKFMGVSCVEEIQMKHYGKAWTALRRKVTES